METQRSPDYQRGYRAGHARGRRERARPEGADAPTVWSVTRGQSVFCACGAQWHGEFTTSPYIPRHEAHGFVEHDAFLALGFRCKSPYRHHCQVTKKSWLIAQGDNERA